MKQQRKEFIKQAHSAASSEWKEKIETEFPKLFKKDELVVGQWYKYDDNFLNVLMVWNNSKETYGFSSGFFRNRITFYDTHNKIPATDKEVSKALISEASKRGFKKGVTIKSTWIKGSDNTEKLTSDDVFIYDNFEMRCMGKYGYYTIFKDGVWAEIIEEPVNVLKSDLELAALALKEMSNAFSEWKEEPVYEWQYVYVNNGLIRKVSEHYYTSKKDFSSKAQSFNKPIKKVKGSKRIRK